MSEAEPSATDVRFMTAAIRLGRRELGRTWPNPAVGALIVCPSGVIVGRGWTQPGGRPHAETVALEEAGTRARDATAYVSLEPCAHHGGTPPCAEALVGAGLARVVSALEDPDPRVAGTGHAALRSAGIAVSSGLCAQAARAVHAGHIMRAVAGRPWVTLKLAVSRDGYIAGAERGPLEVTGAQARARVHMMRATSDAVVVGVGTARADDPQLTCRLPGMADRSPVRIVLDSRLQLSPRAKLLARPLAAPVWIVTAQPEAAAAADLEAAGARLLPVVADARGRVAIDAALSRLGAEGLTRILVEGGAEVAGALLAGDLVDEAVIFRSEREIGVGGLPAVAGPGRAAITQSEAYTRVDERPVGADRMATYVRVR